MSIESLTWYLGAFLAAISLLVFVHEWGHFAAARLCGVKVLRFSIGFGKVLMSRQWGETQWTLSLLPLGGYVKMLDGRESPVPAEESPRAFDSQPVLKRTFIVSAGPLANFILAILLYWALYMHGVTDMRPVLGPPVATSAASQAGIQSGETVVALDRHAIASWSELRIALLEAVLNHRSFMLVTRNEMGTVTNHYFDARKFADLEPSEDPARDLGLQLFRPDLKPLVGMVVPDSPADRAGLVAGDRILAIDNLPINSWDDVVNRVRQHPDAKMTLTVERQSEQRKLEVVSESIVQEGIRTGRIGVSVAPDPVLREFMIVHLQYGTAKALHKSVTQVIGNCRLTLVMLKKMIFGEVSLRNLSGPVAIADYAGQSARLGVAPYLGFLALISVSIGLLNLLPIPVLDGGHLLYYLLELFKGNPVSPRFQEVGQYIGLGTLGILMTVAIINDLHRLIVG